MQRQTFDQRYLSECGLTPDTCPLDRKIQRGEVKSQYTGIDNVCWLGCSRVERHTDGYLLPRYTAILIIQNTGLIAKPCSLSKKDISPQFPGTVLILDIHRYHHCISDRRIAGSDNSPLLLAVDIAYQDKPQLQEVEERFRKFLRDFRLKTVNVA
jgi:hypothetical protein